MDHNDRGSAFRFRFIKDKEKSVDPKRSDKDIQSQTPLSTPTHLNSLQSVSLTTHSTPSTTTNNTPPNTNLCKNSSE